jgi:hypothetical protein
MESNDMADGAELEIYRALREAQSKYAYFLLAAVGAAIAFALNQTQGVTLTCSQLPLGAAVVAWGLSFFFGCRHLAYVSSTLYSNAQMFRAERGQHPEVGPDPQRIALATAAFKAAAEENSNRGNRFGHLQFRLFVAGGVSYIVWHVLEMYIRTVSPCN